MIASWITIIVVVVVAFAATRKMRIIPRRLQGLVEVLLEMLLNFVESVAGKKDGRRFFPVVATIFLHAVFLRLLVILEADPHGRISYVGGSDLWVLAACGYFSITVLLLGIGTLVASVRLMVRRFQGLLAALCFVGCLYVYGRLLQPVVSRLDFLGTYDLTVIEKAAGAEEIQHAQPELQVLLYSCVMGLLFLGMGTWLIEKRVEA